MKKNNHAGTDNFNTEAIKWLLPEYPRIAHVPHNPNMSPDDVLADRKVLDKILSEEIYIQEKVDGASCGMAFCEGIGYIRNRKHVLNKAYTKIKTPAKIQFLSAWNWLYENKKKFEKLNEELGEEVCVFGDWCLYQHGTVYDKLPDKLICYDIYVPSKRTFLKPDEALTLLFEIGFKGTIRLFKGTLNGDLNKLARFSNIDTYFSKSCDLKAEGVVIKLDNGERYKMVNPNYVSNFYWSEKQGNLQPCWQKNI